MGLLNLDDASQEPKLDKARHVKYWTRCLKTLLPHQYTSNDSNRMYLAFFIIAALDILDALHTVPNENERKDYIAWIYQNQHPGGGFRMWPGTDFGERASKVNALWDPANVPATYFALASLLILGDDFKRVKRQETLTWLRQMQRPDGSFAETLVDGQHEGGMDPRFGYCATGIRHILRGHTEGPITVDGEHSQDIDVDALVGCIRLAETFEGGLADAPFHEPHAGYTFCSLGALSFVSRINLRGPASEQPVTAPVHPEDLLSWLVYRQIELTDPDARVDSEFAGTTQDEDPPNPESGQIKNAQKTDTIAARQTAANSVGVSIFDLLVDGAGMSGRTNKVADTCYGFWVGASLHIMQQPKLYDYEAVRRYLLGKTQHTVLGGHGKFPGDLPDLLHSYLGLAALSLAGSDQLKELDGGMCLSKEARARLPPLWEQWGIK